MTSPSPIRRCRNARTIITASCMNASRFITTHHTDLWMIASHELAVEALTNWKVFSSAIDLRRDVGGPDTAESDALFEKEGYLVRDVLTQVDPPRHTVFRKLVDRTFTGPVVRRMEEYLTLHAGQLIDAFIDRGRCDFFNEFAVPLPLGVIADQLGVPQEDMPRFKTWSDAFIETLGIMLSPERKLECTQLIIEYQHYFVDRIEEKKFNPEDDILSGLVAARHEDGSELSTEELLALVQQLLVAGNRNDPQSPGQVSAASDREPPTAGAVARGPLAGAQFRRGVVAPGKPRAGSVPRHDRGHHAGRL